LKSDSRIAASAGSNAVSDANVVFDGTKSLIKMKLGVNPAYLPSDEYTVRAGFPVRMEINGVGTGCRSVFQIPKLGVSVNLNQQINIAEFTPTKPGDYTFSCSMGMFRGVIRAL
jgi:plastocyanin domain-containing protein